MSRATPVSAKRNCLWPLRSSAKGWHSSTLAQRYLSALTHLWRTAKGSIIWSPDYGTDIYKYRTQSFNDTDIALMQDDLLTSTALWVPDITILQLEFIPGEALGLDDELIQIHAAWGIPYSTDIASGSKDASDFALGPMQNRITV